MATSQDEFDDPEFDLSDIDDEALESMMTTFESTQLPQQQPSAPVPAPAPAASTTTQPAQRNRGPFQQSNGKGNGSAPASVREPLAKRPAFVNQVRRADTYQDELMLPEVSVQANGNYSVEQPHPSRRPPHAPQQPANATQPHQDEAIVVQNRGHSYLPGMPQLSSSFDDEAAGPGADAIWADTAALEQAEQEAISMSQQSQAHPQPPPVRTAIDRSTSRHDSPGPSVQRTTSTINQTGSFSNLEARPARVSEAVAANRKEMQYTNRIEALQRRVQTQQDAINKLKEEAAVPKGVQSAQQQTYKELGEMLMLRSKTTKLENENMELRRSLLEKEEMHRQSLEAEKQRNAQNVEKLKTIDAFARFERDASSRWPEAAAAANAAAAGPSTVQGQGKTRAEQEVEALANHQAAGLLTPSRRRAGANVTPSRSVNGKAHTPSKQVESQPEFDGLDNAFEASQHRSAARKSPATPSARSSRSRQRTAGPASQRSPIFNMDEGMQIDETDFPALFPQAITLDPKSHYVWAVSQLQTCRAQFVSFILEHESIPHTRPPNIPFTAFHQKMSDIGLSDTEHGPRFDHCPYPSGSQERSTSTIVRLISTRLPPGTHPNILQLHSHALDMLVQELVPDAAADAEQEFVDLLTRPAYTSGKEANESFWSLQDQVLSFDAIQGSMQAIAAPVRNLFGIFSVLFMIDAFNDLLQLCADAACVFPHFIDTLATPSKSLSLVRSGPTPSTHMNTFTIPTRLSAVLADMSIKVYPVSHPTNADMVKLDASGRSRMLDAMWETFDFEVPEAEHGSHWDHPDAKRGREMDASVRNAAWRQQVQARWQAKWDMGEQVREEFFEASIAFFKSAAYRLRESVATTTDSFLYSVVSMPGLMSCLLDPERAPSNLIGALELLAELSHTDILWQQLIACPLDLNFQHKVPAQLRQSKTPLFEIIAKHLVDRRSDLEEKDAHKVHVAAIRFLSSLADGFNDARLIIADSKHLLAALVSCLSADTTQLWSTRSLPDQEAFNALLERLWLDLNLMTVLYSNDQDDAQKLNSRLEHPQTQAVLNGVKHALLVALSRIAFAEEHESVQPLHTLETERKMEALADQAASLLELILSPEELDDIWQMLAGDDDDDSGRTGEEDDALFAGNDNAIIID